MSDAAMLGTITEIKRNSGWFIFLGILFLIGGVFAIAMPGLAGLTFTVVVGVSLFVLGIFQVIQAWSIRSWGGFIWQLVIGIILILGGLSLYFDPFAGTLTLTIIVAAIFLAKGVMQVIMSFQMRPHAGWGWILVAGIVAILVGLIIFMGFPETAFFTLGTLAGISLIFSGWSYIMVAMAARRLA